MNFYEARRTYIFYPDNFYHDKDTDKHIAAWITRRVDFLSEYFTINFKIIGDVKDKLWKFDEKSLSPNFQRYIEFIYDGSAIDSCASYLIVQIFQKLVIEDDLNSEHFYKIFPKGAN